MGNFFETASQKAQRLEQEKKAKFRSIGQLIENLQQKHALMGKECTSLWNKAKKELAGGDKSAAAATLKLFKMKKVSAERYARFLVMVENKLASFSSADDMQSVMKALKEFAAGCRVDVDQFEEDMAQTEEVMEDIRDMDKIMNGAWERENRRIDRELESCAADDDDPLLKSLEESIKPAAKKSAPAAEKITEENVDDVMKALLNA